MFVCVCINVLPACMSLHHMHVWCKLRSGEGMGSPGTELQMVVSCYVGTVSMKRIWWHHDTILPHPKPGGEESPWAPHPPYINMHTHTLQHRNTFFLPSRYTAAPSPQASPPGSTVSLPVLPAGLTLPTWAITPRPLSGISTGDLESDSKAGPGFVLRRECQKSSCLPGSSP